MAMTFDGQRSKKTGQCAKEEVSSSLLGKLAPPCLCIFLLANPTAQTVTMHSLLV